jgi:CheY-like chemotaxis protein
MSYVLLVDDDEAIRESLSLIIEDRGYTVRTAEHGRRAIEIIAREGNPCFALVDLMMPVMDGLELIERLREDPARASIPIAVFSGGSSVEPPPGTTFLRKPLGSQVILCEIARYCTGA